MGRRREPRTEVCLQVRLMGMDASGRPVLEQAESRNISRRGANLRQILRQLKLGDPVVLRHGTRTGRFRVAWVGEAVTPWRVKWAWSG